MILFAQGHSEFSAIQFSYRSLDQVTAANITLIASPLHFLKFNVSNQM